MSGSTETAVLAAALIATASGPAVAETIRRRASSFSVTASDAAKAAKAALMGENKEPVKLAPAPSQTAAADDAEFAAVDALRAAIPAHCWTKDTVRSIGYLLQDSTILLVLYAVYPHVPNWLMLPWILTTGFFMWCLFVVGHDCGHSTFSPYPLLNSIIGNLSHGFLVVPFQPWANSHAVHHRYHNHVEWDKSHPWFVEEHYQPEGRYELMLYWVPVLAYYLYLIGVGDGSHYVPWVGSIGSDADKAAKAVHRGDLRDWISTFSSLAIPTAMFFFWAQGSWKDFFIGYACPLMIFNAWLTIVTWNQHHSSSVRAWKDIVSEDGTEKTNWSFARGAFETVDRTYGWPIDELSHNITDSHLVHHVFAREIPHYRIKEATEAIKAAGVAKGYKYVKEIPYIGFLLSYYQSVWACRVMVKGSEDGEYVPHGNGPSKVKGQ